MAANGPLLVAIVLREHFGTTAELVGKNLVRSGKLSLRQIAVQSGIPMIKVQKCVMVLLQHQLLQVTQSPGHSFLTYRLKQEDVSRMLRYPRYAIVGRNM